MLEKKSKRLKMAYYQRQIDTKYKYSYNKDCIANSANIKVGQQGQSSIRTIVVELQQKACQKFLTAMIKGSILKVVNLFFRIKSRQMITTAIHYCIKDAKQAGYVPTSWYLSSNDCTPEICQGSRRIVA